MAPTFETRIAETEDEILAAQRLRYEVFVEELGGGGPLVDHAARLERDAIDPHCQHLLLLDHARSGSPVVGVYRIMDAHGAQAAGGWYSASEYDLTPLERSGRRLLELGRSCLHSDYRGGAGVMRLWQALAALIEANEVEVLFGVASFHGVDLDALAAPLSLLHHRHLAPEGMRPVAIGPAAVRMDRLAEHEIDRLDAIRAVPALIKAYLRLGGVVGQGAWVDQAFNTTDVCLVMDTRKMSARQRAVYADTGRGL